jgi:hypothetical protein
MARELTLLPFLVSTNTSKNYSAMFFNEHTTLVQAKVYFSGILLLISSIGGAFAQREVLI